ncbi:MAG: peroxiredoxin [Alphaproteobacteria bacterium 64-11]|nr:peroxiredoxin [Alphaproteobacteria bacterium]OJU12632.1 MAG: peroxiredoxin [Alphaproteobacteria bacterium 64-11]
MKRQLAVGLLAALCASPAYAALKPGDKAPDFTLPGSLGGKDFTFNLKDALKKGPVVVYFYPSAYTGGCDLEAHTFAENIGKFQAAGASVIGVSADDLTRLKKFSADPSFCAGKFPIASDESTTVAKSYDLNVSPAREGAKDVNKDAINHAFIERVTYVIGKNGNVLATLSSKTDGLSPDQHVDKSLEIITASK